MFTSDGLGRPQVTRVMIADDHAIVRRGLRALIEATPGWQVCGEAADGQRAVELALETKPDILVLDLTMPGMSGIDALRKIKRALPRIEALVLTMHDSDRHLTEALEAGARGYLVKNEGEHRLMEGLQLLARHQPYFSPSVSETMLKGYLRTGETGPQNRLTPRERQVVMHVAQGKSNKEIASLLNLSVKTVETHRARAMEKTGAKSAADLALYALRNNLVQL